jgi:hypothetical protein
MSRKIDTPEQVVVELRAMSAQFICPKDIYFASMADVVERLITETKALDRTVVEVEKARRATGVALLRYGSHEANCCNAVHGGGCSCGWREAAEAAREAEKARGV